MFNISDYLGKFKNLGQSEKQLKEVVANLIKEMVGVEVLSTNISIKGGVVYLKATPGIKGAVFVKKEKILTGIKERTTTTLIDLR